MNSYINAIHKNLPVSWKWVHSIHLWVAWYHVGQYLKPGYEVVHTHQGVRDSSSEFNFFGGYQQKDTKIRKE